MTRGIAAMFALLFCLLIGPAPAATARHLDFSILEDYDKGEDLTDVAKDFQLFRELGITTWRGSFGWDDYEPTRGHLDLDWLHRFADLADTYGITLRPYIAYTPAWAAAQGKDADAWNDPPRRVGDWERFVRQLAQAMRRHRNIASYEIYNEENVAQWWDGSPRAYADIVRRAADAIKTAAPGVQVLLGGMVFPDTRWIERVCEEGHDGSRIDVIPFHAYPETWTPPDVDLEHYLGPHFHDGFVRTVDAACGTKPIWINETGFATVEGKSERDQAAWWARAIAVFAGETRVEHIGVYEIKDLEPTRAAIGDTPNYHLGITRTDRSKKLAFATIKTMVALMQGALAIDEPRLTRARGEVFVRAFRRADGREIVVAWTKAGAETVDISVAGAAARVVEHHLDGSTSPYASLAARTLANVALQPGVPRIFELQP